jgi:hypothetical protein
MVGTWTGGDSGSCDFPSAQKAKPLAENNAVACRSRSPWHVQASFNGAPATPFPIVKGLSYRVRNRAVTTVSSKVQIHNVKEKKKKN